MSLIECNECKQQISNSAWFCPKCGDVKKNIWLENTEKLYKLFAFLMMIFSAICFFISSQPKNFPFIIVDSVNVLKYIFLASAVVTFVIGVLTCETNIRTKPKST